MSSTQQYRVYITPRAGVTSYGTEVDVTEYVAKGGLQSISQKIDSEDFAIGAYEYGRMQIKFQNRNGYLNDGHDWRSIFAPYLRDQSKIRVEYLERVVNSNQTVTETTTNLFSGIIVEEGTKQDIRSETVSMLALPLDSVLRKANVTAGTIADGTSAESALENILNKPSILKVLTLDVSNITVDLDFTIDVGAEFDGLSVREAANTILLPANSVLYVDSSANIIVSSRDQNVTPSTLNLYGKYDIHGRENILALKGFNLGYHRMANSIKVNDRITLDQNYIDYWGLRQRSFDFNFITATATADSVASQLLSEFKAPKRELEVVVPTRIAKSVVLRQQVSLNYPLRLEADSDFLAVTGDTSTSDSDMHAAREYGSISIDPGVAWKVIEIDHNAVSFQTTLKLREIGTGTGDGLF